MGYGTMLNQRGGDFEECFDELNLTVPHLVAGIHRDYIEAGSQVIQTNTFGANRYKLARHGLEDKVAEINTAGLQVARQAIRDSPQGRVGRRGMGPWGCGWRLLAACSRNRPARPFRNRPLPWPAPART